MPRLEVEIGMTQTASPLEIVWTLIGIIGLITHSILVWRCIVDLSIVDDNHINGAAKMIALANIRRQVIYAIAQVCAVFLGVNAMLAPPNLSAAQDVPIIGATLIIGWEVLLIINALNDHYDRNKLLAYMGGRRKSDSRRDNTSPR